MEDFAFKYRSEYKSYCDRVKRPKWKDVIQGRDIVGNLDVVLTEFNSFLPQMEFQTKYRLGQLIDEAKKEFVKVRKGDEEVRDRNVQHLNDIDRIIQEEIENQRESFLDVL